MLLPNPAKDYLYVQAKHSYAGEVSVMITDYTGKIIWQEQTTFVNSRIKIQTDKYSTGVYVIRVISKDGLHYNSRFNVRH